MMRHALVEPKTTHTNGETRRAGREASGTVLLDQEEAEEPQLDELVVAADADEDDAPDNLDETAIRGGGTDLVRQYLREIGRVALLTAADAVELARRREARGLAGGELH